MRASADGSTEMFEGLGLGSRLAFLRLPRAWRHAPVIGGILYALMTPLGMAIGLGARQSLVSRSLASEMQ